MNIQALLNISLPLLMAFFTFLSSESKKSTMSSNKESGEFFKLGTATVTVHIDGISPDSIGSVTALTSPIFIDPWSNDNFVLTKTSPNIFTGNVLLEQPEEIAGIFIEGSNVICGLPLFLNQTQPTEIFLTFSPIGEFINAHTTDSQDLTVLELSNITKAYMDFLESEKCQAVPKSLYPDWKKVMKYNIEYNLKETLDETLKNHPIPKNAKDWFVNSLLMHFAAYSYIPYSAIAKMESGIEVEEPPMEAYSWLDNIDYSGNFIKHIPYIGPKPFLSTLLRYPAGGFERIGETPVAQWQEYAANKLKAALKKPSRLLLDLMSAMSYVLQIENDFRPLSPVQIENINKGYGDDLGKIVLKKNDELLAILDNMDEMTDLSSESFILKDYIDKEFPGQPVAVDMWNTWCGPCLDAIGKVGAIKDTLPKNVPFLYLSDTSSDIDAWKRKADKIHGKNVRISKEDSAKIGEQYQLQGFPSYLFFDKHHNLIHSQTSFPGLEEYTRLLNQISR